MKRFEYKLVDKLKTVSNLTSSSSGSDEELLTLDNLGYEGWEMCGNTGNGRSSGSYIFKREITED